MARPDISLIPVADLSDRLRAGLWDAGFLALAYVFFLGLFISLGGRLSLARTDLLISALTFVLLYAQYFTLFSLLGPATPGMHLCGLTVVSFDGASPSASSLLWRSFGYLLSGGTLFLGFLWTLWDEDSLAWPDRISQTYVASATSVALASSLLPSRPARS